MNDRQIETFVAAAETLSLTETARLLYVTQPAATYQIKSLESELGARLFDRSPTGLSLTEAGCAFLPHARSIAREISSGRGAVAPFREGRRIVIGCAPIMISVDADLFSALMEGLRRRFPDYDFDLAISERSFDAEMLKSGQAHMVIANLARKLPSNAYNSRFLFDSPNYVLVAERSRLSSFERLSPADIEGCKVYISAKESNYTQTFARKVDAATGKSLVMQTVASFEMVPVSVSRGDGIAFSPFPLSATGVTCIPFEFDYTFSLYAVWLKKRDHGLLESVADVIATMFELRSSEGAACAIEWLQNGSANC